MIRGVPDSLDYKAVICGALVRIHLSQLAELGLHSNHKLEGASGVRRPGWHSRRI